MKEFTKSLSSFALGMSLFGLKQIQNLMTPTETEEDRSPATKAMDSVTDATVNQFGGTLRSTFHAADNVQRGIIGLAFSLLWPFRTSNNTDRNDGSRDDGNVVDYTSADAAARDEELRARDEEVRRRAQYQRHPNVSSRSQSHPVRAEESLGRSAEMPVRVVGRRR